MPIPLLIPAAVAGVSALSKLFHGIGQNEDAKSRAARNKRPDFDIEQEYFDNQAIAENLAGQGFTSATKENYNDQNERGLQATIDATLQAGGGPNTVQTALGTYNLGNRTFAAADAEKQTQNIKDLYEQNKTLAGQRTQQWVLNEYKPFQDEAAAIAQEKAAGAQNVNTAFNEATAIASSIYQSGVSKDLFGTTDTPDGEAGGDRKEKWGNYNATHGFNPRSVQPFGDKPGTPHGNQFADYYQFLQDSEGADKNSLDGLTPEQIAAMVKAFKQSKVQ